MTRNAATPARSHLHLGAALVLAAASVACGGGDGGGGGEPPMEPDNSAPSASISSPSDGTTFQEGETVVFEGSAEDPEDGSLTGDALVWESDVAGQIGTGESFERSDLDPADHAITLTATDSDGATAASDVSITVEGPGTVDGRVARANDDTGFGGVEVTLKDAGGSVVASASTSSDGTYSFSGVAPGDYTVSVPRESLPELGTFVTSSDTSITVGNAETVSGVDFRFRQAEATVTTTTGSEGSPSPGDVVTVTVALELNADVPEPLSSVAGEISWDPAVAGFVTGTGQAGSDWDLGVVNASGSGVLTFSAVSAGGAESGDGGDLVVLTFDMEATGTGSTDVAPSLSELQELDPASGASEPLLPDLLVEEAASSLDVQ